MGSFWCWLDSAGRSLYDDVTLMNVCYGFTNHKLRLVEIVILYIYILKVVGAGSMIFFFITC